MARRGSYAKGVAKREEILERALEVIATEGYDGASVKRIAEAVGLSQAGLLHYFDSKEELFTEVLRKRDEHDRAHFGLLREETDPGPVHARASFVRVVRHNADVPGLVELFSRLAVEAAHPDHPAHEYFLERGENFRTLIERNLAGQDDAAPVLPPEVLTRVLQAVSDGLQLQWLLDPTVDMAATLDHLMAVLIPASESAPDQAQREGAV
ncbi:TetR/AcrR family transcriptional regulator [Microbacterium schleiferi]|uniref:TetR/AcrR family transcriptional regulator n=1 Tax=Microbacterium schleiferi TaxID=69362 RepID=A0A7S8MVZ7_9MICO|nr:TetR/AcrR family transcriptional regulator [Microbacterium schleiferi]QPE04304.1 TetR/AcrR family transcriptional regulator [Microbacterium schleiferi]